MLNKQRLHIATALIIALITGLMARDIHDNSTCSEAAIDTILDGGTLELSDRCRLTLTSPKTVTGQVEISGGHLAGRGRDSNLFMVQSGAHLTLRNTELKNANVGITVQDNARLILADSRISNNEYGIQNSGTAIIADTRFAFNTCVGCSGAAIENNGKIAIEGSVFSRNRVLRDPAPQNVMGSGAAIANRGQLTITATKFDNNRAPMGGAIMNIRGNVTIEDSTFYLNEATLSDTRSDGGAILNQAEMTITDSFFHHNSVAHRGGAIHNTGSLNIHQSVFKRNQCRLRDCESSILHNDANSTVDARYNYWHDGNEPTTAMTNLPPEAYTPYLTREPLRQT